MKTVIKHTKGDNLIDLADFLTDEGFDDIVIFSNIDFSQRDKIENELFRLGIKAVIITTQATQSTYDLLKSIKGSLTDTFLLIYSSDIITFNLRDAYNYHKSTTNICTLLSNEKKTVGIFLENEVFDYMARPLDFEKRVVARIFEDSEASIYELVSHLL